MTDLLSRPGARDGGTHQAPGPKPVALSAVVGAGACLLTGLVACTSVAVVGWLAASFGGASGAVRAGAVTWLAAHKATVDIGGGTFSVPPLGLTLVVGYCLYRAGRFAARVSAADLTRELVLAAVVLAVGYGGGAALVALLASNATAAVSPLSAFVAATSVALVAGTAGVLVESGAAEDIADATPDWLRDAVPAGLAAAGSVVTAAAALYAVALAAHFSRARELLTALDAGPVGSVVLFAVCAVLLPNAVAFCVGFIAGPGFQLGTATVVAPSGVELGNLPALPLLAALPQDGATPSYLLTLTAVVPLLAGAVGGLVVARRVRTGAHTGTGGPVGWDGLGLRAVVAAVVGGALLLALMTLAGGSAGPGRMADTGVPQAVVAAALLTAGMAIGAIVASIAAGRRGDRAAP